MGLNASSATWVAPGGLSAFNRIPWHYLFNKLSRTVTLNRFRCFFKSGESDYYATYPCDRILLVSWASQELSVPRIKGKLIHLVTQGRHYMLVAVSDSLTQMKLLTSSYQELNIYPWKVSRKCVPNLIPLLVYFNASYVFQKYLEHTSGLNQFDSSTPAYFYDFLKKYILSYKWLDWFSDVFSEWFQTN